MLTVARTDLPALRPWFTPELPGPVIFEHVVRTGAGRCRVDRWPSPRVVVAELPGGNVALRGDPALLPTGALDDIAGLVEASAEWLPTLRDIDPDVAAWDRTIAVLPASTAVPAAEAHLLGPGDVAALAAFESDGAWIHETWGGAAAVAAARVARGSYAGDRLVAVALPFYSGAAFEDIGVVTDSAHRRLGHSRTCAAALVGDIRARGRVPSWSTSPENAASLAVAARLGFVQVRTDLLYAFRVPIPVA